MSATDAVGKNEDDDDSILLIIVKRGRMVAGMVVPMVVAPVRVLVMFLDLTSLIPAKSCHALWSQ